MGEDFNEQLIDAANKGDIVKFTHLIKNHGAPLNCAWGARWAAYNGLLECLKILMLSHTLHPTSATLYMAASRGHLSCVEYLIDLVDPLYNNSLAMVEAASNGHVECLRILMNVSDCANHGYTALLESSKNGHIECAQLLVNALPKICLEDLREHFIQKHLDMHIVDQLEAYAQRTCLMHEVGDGTTYQRRKI